MEPLVSFIIPVYNGEKYIREALESVLNQTYRNLEVIIINDGSKDSSLEVLQSYDDSRIKLYSRENKGLAATLNEGIQLAKGEFIARQDQDDISSPERVEKQLDFLNRNPEVGMVGCWASIIDMEGEIVGKHNHPQNNEELQFYLLFNNPFVHSSVMFRKEVFRSVGLYSTDPKRQPPEDYELFSRIARLWKVANLSEVLHKYREVGGSMSRISTNPFLEKVLLISEENIKYAYGSEKSSALVELSAFFFNGVLKRVGVFLTFKIWSFFLSILKKIGKLNFRNFYILNSVTLKFFIIYSARQ